MCLSRYCLSLLTEHDWWDFIVSDLRAELFQLRNILKISSLSHLYLLCTLMIFLVVLFSGTGKYDHYNHIGMEDREYIFEDIPSRSRQLRGTNWFSSRFLQFRRNCEGNNNRIKFRRNSNFSRHKPA